MTYLLLNANRQDHLALVNGDGDVARVGVCGRKLPFVASFTQKKCIANIPAIIIQLERDSSLRVHLKNALRMEK